MNTVKSFLFAPQTTVTKTGAEVIWMAVAVLVSAVASAITHNPSLFSVEIVAIARVALILVASVLDFQTPNI